MKKTKSQKKFNSKGISLKELEERKEMLIIWNDKDGWFPECRSLN